MVPLASHKNQLFSHEVGNEVNIEDEAIHFRPQLGDGVTIETGAIVVGVTLPNDARVVMGSGTLLPHRTRNQ